MFSKFKAIHHYEHSWIVKFKTDEFTKGHGNRSDQ